MSNWLHRILSEPVSAPAGPNSGGGPDASSSWPQTPLTPRTAARMRDPNAPDYRYQVNQKCIYERRLPGGSYITAHVQRLQSGFYDSPVIHEDRIDNVRFIAVNFVFHPSSSTFRFKGAEINIALHHTGEDKRNSLQVVAGLAPAKKNSHDHGTQTETVSNALVKSSDCLRVAPGFKPSRPKFLRHAPHLLYGGISPETLNWNFNLAGSLGVSQGPASASFKPSYGVKSSYKIYEMMKIQGSVRTLRSWYGHEYDIEDGELVWTLEENKLQKSGLPREFTFVMLLTKGSGGFEQSGDVRLEIDVRPKVTGPLGATYPSLITNLHQYQPFKREVLDLDEEIGQVFEPQIKGKGFNFANIATSFDDFVWLPGTAYSTSDAGVAQSPTTGGAAQQQQQQQQQQQAPQQQIMAQQQSQQGSQSHHRSGTQQQQQSLAAAGGDTTLNLRVFLEGPSRGNSGSPVPFSNQQVMQQLVPYVNLKVPPPNPSRAQSPSVMTSGGSRTSNSTSGPRRTITIGSSKSRSVRKRRSRTGLSGEYYTKELPAEEGKSTDEQRGGPQRSGGRGQVISLSAGGGDSGGQGMSPAPARPFSYQGDRESQGNDLIHDSNAAAAASSASEWPEHNPNPDPNPTPKPQTKNASTTTPLLRPSSSEYATPPAYPHPRPVSMPGGLDHDHDAVWDGDVSSPAGRV